MYHDGDYECEMCGAIVETENMNTKVLEVHELDEHGLMDSSLMPKEEIAVNLKEDGFFDVKVNKELLVHTRKTDMGYTVDVYRDNNDPEKMENSGFIDAITVWEDDLSTDEDFDEDEEE